MEGGRRTGLRRFKRRRIMQLESWVGGRGSERNEWGDYEEQEIPLDLGNYS